MKKAYIIPGYAATPQDHWFQSLAKTLQKQDIPTQVIEFPSPQVPSLSAWLEHLGKVIKDLDRDSIIIAHSLGCITAVRFLLELRPKSHIKALVLVSPFAEKLPNLPQLDEFSYGKVDIAKVKSYADTCKIIVSDNDTIVSPEATRRFAAAAGVAVYEIKSGGHFLAEDGYTTFPALAREVAALE